MSNIRKYIDRQMGGRCTQIGFESINPVFNGTNTTGSLSASRERTIRCGRVWRTSREVAFRRIGRSGLWL